MRNRQDKQRSGQIEIQIPVKRARRRSKATVRNKAATQSLTKS